jgi:hypothetical protein
MTKRLRSALLLACLSRLRDVGGIHQFSAAAKSSPWQSLPVVGQREQRACLTTDPDSYWQLRVASLPTTGHGRRNPSLPYLPESAFPTRVWSQARQRWPAITRYWSQSLMQVRLRRRSAFRTPSASQARWRSPSPPAIRLAELQVWSTDHPRPKTFPADGARYWDGIWFALRAPALACANLFHLAGSAGL